MPKEGKLSLRPRRITPHRADASPTLQRVRAPPAPLPPDRFSTLPAELLHIIFELADEQYLTQPLAKPICKALLPYTTRLLYRAIAIRLPGHGKLKGRVPKLRRTLEK